jgi:uncharacterized protein
MNSDRQGVEVLSPTQCLRLIRRSSIGRVVVSLGALPAAFPVNFALLDDDVVFRTAFGTKLSAALDDAIVAFEVDRIDPLRHTGWSVLIQGRASILDAPADVVRARRLGIRPWAPGEHPHFVRIRSEVVSGRRLPATADILAEPFVPDTGSEAVRSA